MKMCVGCKHLVAFGAACKAAEVLVRTVDPLTNRVSWRSVDGHVFRPTPAEMRSTGAKCGPDATLYEPTLIRRLFNFLGGR